MQCISTLLTETPPDTVRPRTARSLASSCVNGYSASGRGPAFTKPVASASSR